MATKDWVKYDWKVKAFYLLLLDGESYLILEPWELKGNANTTRHEEYELY